VTLIDKLDEELKDLQVLLQERLGRILEVKDKVKKLPPEIQSLDGEASIWSRSRIYITLRGGESVYSKLQELGFDFPQKLNFLESNQAFYREGSQEIPDGDNPPIKVIAIIYGFEKPPQCEIVEEEVMEKVTKYKAICKENGEEL